MKALPIALAIVVATTPFIVRFAAPWGLIDIPNERSSHKRPIPRGGGIAVAVATVAGTLLAHSWIRSIGILITMSGILALIGLYDDRRGLPPMARLPVQLAAPFLGAIAFADRQGLARLALIVFVSVLVAGYVNAFNFMDGINGIAATQAVVAGLACGILADDIGAGGLRTAALAVVGAGLGFLPFNAVKPKIFLGDAGSYFVGAWLAGLALLLVDAGVSPSVVVAPFLLYLVDTSTTLLGRIRRRARLTEAHREHVYQRLVDAGWSHVVVSAVCAMVSTACCFVMHSVRDESRTLRLLALTCCIGLVACYVVLPQVDSRIRSRKWLAP